MFYDCVVGIAVTPFTRMWYDLARVCYVSNFRVPLPPQTHAYSRGIIEVYIWDERKILQLMSAVLHWVIFVALLHLVIMLN